MTPSFEVWCSALKLDAQLWSLTLSFKKLKLCSNDAQLCSNDAQLWSLTLSFSRMRLSFEVWRSALNKFKFWTNDAQLQSNDARLWSLTLILFLNPLLLSTRNIFIFKTKYFHRSHVEFIKFLKCRQKVFFFGQSTSSALATFLLSSKWEFWGEKNYFRWDWKVYKWN